MASAILFESRTILLATVQHNWQCILWLYIDSTKEFHVRRYDNISNQDGCIYVHCLHASRLAVVFVLGECRFNCILCSDWVSHSRCERIGSIIERGVIPFNPIFIGPVQSSDISQFTIGPFTGQSYRVAEPLRTPMITTNVCMAITLRSLRIGGELHS